MCNPEPHKLNFLRCTQNLSHAFLLQQLSLDFLLGISSRLGRGLMPSSKSFPGNWEVKKLAAVRTEPWLDDWEDFKILGQILCMARETQQDIKECHKVGEEDSQAGIKHRIGRAGVMGAREGGLWFVFSFSTCISQLEGIFVMTKSNPRGIFFICSTCWAHTKVSER